MKKQWLVALSLAASVSISGWVHGDDKAVLDEVQANIQKVLPQLKVKDIEPAPVNGLYQVLSVNNEVFYVTRQADYFFEGTLYQSKGGSFVNLTKALQDKERLVILRDIKDEDTVVFPAEGEAKEVLTVFTDPTCGYCLKFHGEVPAIQKMGVTVRYVAWPRSGANSQPGKTLAGVWCAEDQQDAMNRAKSRQSVPPAPDGCDGNIAEQVNLGRKVGVSGTPAVFTSNGTQIGGYMSADKLAKMLDQLAKQ